ncbi:DUF305 domain-containing protein [Streptomyces sp. NPDC046831]|uniref:DUF305 domain-containing protein n=1 Tax=Streptomyces sp. NPDC046831 TaxID=3154805 RepID=UPI0033C41070
MALRRFPVRRAAGLAAVATAALLLTACGGGDSSPSGAAGHSGHGTSTTAPSSTAPARKGGHNAHDVTFAQEMIPHHRQAVAMARLAPQRAKSQEVKDLAAAISEAQDPEIRTMTGWLRAWGEDVPADDGSGMADMPGMHHSGASMPGMVPDAGMEELGTLSGDAFDKAFLRMMVGHHEGAVEMARAEQAQGGYGPAKQMAGSIVASQSAEISAMRKMLGSR